VGASRHEEGEEAREGAAAVSPRAKAAPAAAPADAAAPALSSAEASKAPSQKALRVVDSVFDLEDDEVFARSTASLTRSVLRSPERGAGAAERTGRSPSRERERSQSRGARERARLSVSFADEAGFRLELERGVATSARSSMTGAASARSSMTGAASGSGAVAAAPASARPGGADGGGKEDN
jgi:hypothetical protein